MSEIISKKELEELKTKFKREERGLPFKSEATYVLEKEGEEGLKKLEDAMAKLGYPIEYKKVSQTGFYPSIIEVLTLICIKKLFNYDDKEFEKIGEFSVKLPTVIRTIAILRKYFTPSKEMLNKVTSKIWKQYFMWGNLKVPEYDEIKKRVVLRLEDYPNHRLNCRLITGGIKGVFQVFMGSKTTCEEVKCIHRGDPYHEFLIKW